MLAKLLPEIEKESERFKSNVDNIATVYLASDAGARLLMSLELPEGHELEMRLSNNFHDSATTIRNPDDVLALYRSGSYARLIAYQAVVNLCSNFESWVDAISQIVKAPTIREIKISSWRRKSPNTVIKTKALCTASAIHQASDIESQLVSGESLCWIYNFFLVRNVIVHNGGVLTAQHRARLVGKWQDLPDNIELEMVWNDIDDMVHFMKANIAAFVYKFRERWVA